MYNQVMTAKKEVRLNGRLMYPPEVGCPAFILDGEGYLRTSPVCSVAQGDGHCIVIETRNSIYILNSEVAQYGA